MSDSEHNDTHGKDENPADSGTETGAHSQRDSFAAQIHRNLVALISLILAISSLAYNSWRNETSEDQRNFRHAGFTVLEELGRLQQVVDQRYYAGDSARGDTIMGWGHVLMIRDLTSLMPDPAPLAGEELFALWQSLDMQIRATADSALPLLEQQISATRSAVIATLRELE